MKNLLHELHMRWKIRRILAYNKRHPEQCFNLGDYINKQGISNGQGNMRAQDFADFVEKLKADSQQGVHRSLVGGGDNNG